ncbi:MAG: acyl-CoA dehydrogenase family protein [Actinomycetota bacterium]
MTMINHKEAAAENLLLNADSLRAQLRANAAEADVDRRLAKADVDDMTAAGLLSMWTPSKFGGAETSVRTLSDAVRRLGQGDGSAGWLAGVSNASLFAFALFSDEAQQEVWGEGRPIRGAGVLAPSGSSVVVDGGIRLSGRWPYMSGITVADWVFVTAPLNGELGPQAELGFVLVPRADIEIDDTWFVMGMRATASSTAVLNEVFVPEHRILRWANYRPDSYTGLYRSGVFSALAIGIASAVIGEAEHALEIVIEKAPSRPIVTTTYRSQVDSAAFQVEVAKAAQLVQAARLTLEQTASEMDEAIVSGRPITTLDKSRDRANTSNAISLAWEAVDILASAHGTSTFMESNTLGRLWRNVAVARRHVGLSDRVANEILGRTLLGLDPNAIGPTL